jgi:pimeloyl-ACP methyl ester carboxylesterase
MPTVFSDDELRVMRVPTLLLIGDHEVISDPATALARAHRLMPHFEGEHVRQPIPNRGRASARFPEDETN